MNEESLTRAEVQAAMTEWHRQFKKDPQAFVGKAAVTAMTPEELGRRNTDALFQIAQELRNSTGEDQK